MCYVQRAYGWRCFGGDVWRARALHVPHRRSRLVTKLVALWRRHSQPLSPIPVGAVELMKSALPIGRVHTWVCVCVRAFQVSVWLHTSNVARFALANIKFQSVRDGFGDGVFFSRAARVLLITIDFENVDERVRLCAQLCVRSARGAVTTNTRSHIPNCA